MEKEMDDLLKAFKVVLNTKAEDQAAAYQSMKGWIREDRERLKKKVI